MKIKQENFIECSLAMGASKIRILFEHILINITSPLIVTTTLNLSGIILLESALSYLGLGIQPPNTSLGMMVSAGRSQLTNSWWLAVIPIIVIVIIVMCVSLIGDWLRDRLDPKLQNRS
jgi:peptide/nickel transport system permease protein